MLRHVSLMFIDAVIHSLINLLVKKVTKGLYGYRKHINEYKTVLTLKKLIFWTMNRFKYVW